MKCKKCGTIFSEGKFCPNCGTKYDGNKEYIQSQNITNKKSTVNIKKKWYEKTGVILILLILFFPVGLFLMWKYKKNWNVIVKIIISILGVFFAWGLLSPTEEGENYKNNKEQDNTQTIENKSSNLSNIYEGMPEKSIQLALNEERNDIPEEVTVSFQDVNDGHLKNVTQKSNNKLIKKQKVLGVQYIDNQVTPIVLAGIDKIEDQIIESNAELESIYGVASFATKKGVTELTDEKIYVWFEYQLREYDEQSESIVDKIYNLKVTSTVDDCLNMDSYQYFTNEDFDKSTDENLVHIISLIAGANSPFYTHYTESGENGSGPSMYYSPDTKRVNYVRPCETDEKMIKDDLEIKRGKFDLDDQIRQKAIKNEEAERFEKFVDVTDYVREEGALSTIAIHERKNNTITFSIFIGADGADSIYCRDSIVANYDPEKDEAIYQDGDYQLILSNDSYGLSIKEVNRKEGDISFEGEYSDEERSDAGIVFKDSQYYLIDDTELEKYLSEKKIYYIARNEIYARHGRKFEDEKLQKYFDACTWYNGVIEPEDFDESELSYTEKENLKSIADFENRE